MEVILPFPAVDEPGESLVKCNKPGTQPCISCCPWHEESTKGRLLAAESRAAAEGCEAGVAREGLVRGNKASDRQISTF